MRLLFTGFQGQDNGKTYDNVERHRDTSDEPTRIAQGRREGLIGKVVLKIKDVEIFSRQLPDSAHQSHGPDRAERQEHQHELRNKIYLTPYDPASAQCAAIQTVVHNR